jgi:ferredoxin
MEGRSGLLARRDFGVFVDALLARYRVIGPRVRDGAIVYDAIAAAADLAAGVIDEQEAGRYRLVPDPQGRMFAYAMGPHSWKQFLFPPRQELWSGTRDGADFTIEPAVVEAEPTAFFGVRACELAAIAIQDAVFLHGPYVDSGYAARRAAAFFVAINCVRSAATCFCASMQTGPGASDGFDLALTELGDGRFLVEAGSEGGVALLETLALPPATAAARARAAREIEAAAAAQTRSLPANAERLLKDNLEHPQWADVAARCLSCTNCTLVCPTCFCSTVEDVTDLTASQIARRRRWDSCFTLEHSYIHGGSIRREPAARYRQWLTHKLSFWHDQFGTSGCTGCGRCIAWCPAAIDLTAEVAAIAGGVHVVPHAAPEEGSTV